VVGRLRRQLRRNGRPETARRQGSHAEGPFPWFFPYDAHYDEQGYTWTGGTNADRVARLNLASGEWNFFLLPFEANIRDINLQPAASGGLSGLWIGHAHEGLITLVEPLAK
jgi:hypothetical protein